MTAAETIRSLKHDDRIVLISEEPHLPYSRTLLPDFIAGRVALDKLWLRSDSHYKEVRIETQLETRVVSVVPEQQKVCTEKGEDIYFDRLLIACGGEPKLPEIAGIERVPILTLKTLNDARHILSVLQKRSRMLVLARDLVGIEITRAFCQMGLKVTYVEWGDELLPHILDPATAEELAERMKQAGVNLVLGETVREVESDGDAILLRTDARAVSGDFFSVAIGKMPRLDWLRSSGIMMDSGIIADERLRTNFPGIYAAGDTAEIYDPKTQKRKLLFGWKNAVEQGRVAGANMVGEMKEFEVTYAPGLKQIFGVDVRHRWK